MRAVIKKIIKKTVLFAFLFSISAFCFAKTDLQFAIGARGTNANFDSDDLDYYWYWRDINEDFGGFEVSLSNYNLFNINKLFSLGFMESLAFALEANDDNHIKMDISTFDIIIGPALGFNLKNILKFQGMFGIVFDTKRFNWDIKHGKDSHDTDTTIGLATEVQVKFFPKSFISPTAGLKYTLTSSTIDFYSKDIDIDANTYTIYAALCLNLLK